MARVATHKKWRDSIENGATQASSARVTSSGARVTSSEARVTSSGWRWYFSPAAQYIPESNSMALCCVGAFWIFCKKLLFIQLGVNI